MVDGGPDPADARPISRRWDFCARGTGAARRRPGREDESRLDSSDAWRQLHAPVRTQILPGAARRTLRLSRNASWARTAKPAARRLNNYLWDQRRARLG